MSVVVTDPTIFLSQQYDVIVIGGGTAGLAVAARLSEHVNICVGVLEAGLDKSDDPIIASGGKWLQTSVDPQFQWGFSSTKQVTLSDGNGNGRAVSLPRGKLLGGCSAINAMEWVRGSKPEYDALETIFGNKGWNFESLLPYFKKSQAHTVQPSKLFPHSSITAVHGTEGPVKTSQNWWYTSVISPFVRAAQALSFNINSNPDAGNPLGIVNTSRSLNPATGMRQDAASTYLKMVKGRKNIAVLVGAQARRIILTQGSHGFVATGVEFQCHDNVYTVNASKEVILSAGAYQSPQLLELSGIGKQSNLAKYGIETKIDLPVGENLQEHLFLYVRYDFKNETEFKHVLPQGLVIEYVGTAGQDTNNALVATSTVTGSPFLVVNHSSIIAQNKETDVALFDKMASAVSDPLTQAQYRIQRNWIKDLSSTVPECSFMYASLPGVAGIPDEQGKVFYWVPISVFHPTSRGSVHISSADPVVPPRIDLNCLNDYDLYVWKHAVQMAERFASTEPLASLLVPQPPRSDEELDQYIKQFCTTMFHPVGTTAMASRELGGVVDSNLLVYGTSNLRVVDAGVFPIQLGGYPQVTVYAFAEKAADIIKANLGGSGGK